MKNERHAGRKSKIDEAKLQIIRERIAKKDKISDIAKEYGISRQALYKKLNNKNDTLVIDYFVDNKCCTCIELNVRQETLSLVNYTDRLSNRAFGINDCPSWQDLILFLEEQYLGRTMNKDKRVILQDIFNEQFTLGDIGLVDGNGISIKNTDVDIDNIVFQFTKKDILYTRTDTDGYQLKALSKDKRFFVKSQAIISGIFMNDWVVEIIAADICRQLDIPCVEQKKCQFVYGDRVYDAVYSDNFEMDGYSFISFESLLERVGLSTKEQEFICLNAIDKLKWCADKLSVIGKIDYDKTLKYMIDLALIDCLVGNVDRHTRNYGLFYDVLKGTYKIPLIFDNGMGLFEHDSYRDRYTSYDSAMMSVYVSPYGEDPFDMFDMLDEAFDLACLYPGLHDLRYLNNWITPFALEYQHKMLEKVGALWQK